MKKNNFIIILSLFLVFFLIVFFRMYYLIYVNRDEYLQKYNDLTKKIVEGYSAPRGRILDRNGLVLVDNVGVKTIVYNKISLISVEDELSIAHSLVKILDLSFNLKEYDLKKFWLLFNKDKIDVLMYEESILLKSRKITKDEFEKIKFDKITSDMLDSLSEEEKKIAYVYTLMNKGYEYAPKLIKVDVTEEEFAQVVEAGIPGVIGEITWERYYPYNETLRSILGNITSSSTGIPLEKKDYYLNLGYSLNERVGISYLEQQYESFLRGDKAKYLVNADKSFTLLESERRGDDLVLSIDINIQLEIDGIVKNEIEKGKKLRNTEYFNQAYVLVSDPKSGEILAISGMQLLQSNTTNSFKEIGSNVINDSFTVGSVVKGASMSVGYMNEVIDIGDKYYDSCVKLYLVPQKCSFKPLGLLDDISALKQSSNYYQFMIAIGLTNNTYQKNIILNASSNHFDIYRSIFSDFGLGNLTGIDLPNEKKGIKGNTVADDLLLNLSIGQYDTYTPVQLLQYINTIANDGKRLQLSLMKEIVDDSGNVIEKFEANTLGSVEMEQKYFERIKEGFYQVVNYGTGRGFTPQLYRAAGKTGTSETFVDTNNDGIADTKTISSAYVMYAPIDDPKYSMVVMTPNVSHNNGKTIYFAWISRYISREVSKILFENH